jgi:hypothetical protein
MSYTHPLPCGCTVYVACWPDTGVAHTRVIESRARGCRVRTHEVGARIYVWELLPREGLSTATAPAATPALIGSVEAADAPVKTERATDVPDSGPVDDERAVRVRVAGVRRTLRIGR